MSQAKGSADGLHVCVPFCKLTPFYTSTMDKEQYALSSTNRNVVSGSDDQESRVRQ
jgi:hypothetical protein